MSVQKPPEKSETLEDALLTGAFGSVQDWAPFVGTEDATQMLSGLAALGGSQELLQQLTEAVLPPPPGAAARPDDSADPQHALQRFRALVENLPCVAFVAGMGGAHSEVYINPYIEQLLGYSREEWLRDPFLWYWRLHPDDRAAWNEEFARGLGTGGPWQADCRFLAADGRAVWVRGHARIVRDELGRPQFLQGIAFDISGVKQAEVAARARDAEARAALDMLPDAIIVVSSAGAISHMNPAARALLGLNGSAPASVAELARLLMPNDPELFVAQSARCRRTGLSEVIGLQPTSGQRLVVECLPPTDRAQGPVVMRLKRAG